ncbi:3-hydroxyacyl-CoA dehydrogenase PaaH [Pseudoduganella albidiflava]|uniref:3-hydroxyacyl-CoA dehydrogenase n=1 Tax=Pseudoduganella albidiflava TaxID=321983 RepID=A0A411X6W4_9BURK|nr:3-hydroxyacyl-CoA dehydrogenase PaaH [Pseudoduganella albidiflava]QBI04780.1 3-hydroxyacyl-CoA dehydrogenase PaaC [Pseudoduganella albidiflava]GGY62546.1 3-hydroxyacyl-CoA dehydrogenase [Pseudoduganella albidiflava]
MAALTTDSIVAVIGSGAMGAGIAQVAAAAGHTVKLYDARPEAVNRAIDDIAGTFGKLAAKGRMSAAEAEAARGRLQAASSLRDLADAALVIEAIVEQLDAKRALFAELEGVVADEAILATNTSSISVTALGAPLRRPERLVGMHFFNPVPLMALVEVVSGLATDRAVAQAVHDTAAAWGKSPVHARSTPGFIVNRVARPYYAEAWRLLNEGAADTATLDAVMREAGGFRMGPFELMDLIGHDVNYAVTKSVFDAYFGDPRFTPSVLQREMVDAGFLGRKSGRGFYRYGDNAVPPQPKSEPLCPRPEYVGYSLEAGASSEQTAPMLARFEAHGLHVTRRTSMEGHQHGEAPAFHCNGAAIYLTDGRSATARARANRHDDTVVFDLVLDAANAPRIAVARADQCGEAAYQSAVALFQAAGFAVTRLDDVPGLAVMRTVAMLANEAADTVHQGVCSARAVDMAMQKGVNYPRGPLAWADAVGVGHIVTVLDNLAATYGEDRYRVSPLLRRRQAGRKAIHAE